MNKPLKQSIKERLRTVAKERNLTFAEIWHNLILERFLARLCQSKYKTNFVLKGGSLLARYIPIGRETKDLDFLVERLTNTEEFLSKAFDHICSIHIEDGFVFEKSENRQINASSYELHGHRGIIVSKSRRSEMGRQEKVRACYQHACLQWVSGTQMSNSSLRKRLGIKDSNYPMATRILKDSIGDGLIKPYGEQNSKKAAKYVPFWA